MKKTILNSALMSLFNSLVSTILLKVSFIEGFLYSLLNVAIYPRQMWFFMQVLKRWESDLNGRKSTAGGLPLLSAPLCRIGQKNIECVEVPAVLGHFR